MFTVMGSLFVCVIWGGLTGLILTGLLFYLPKAIHVRFGYTPLLLLLLVVFFLFSSLQATLFTGAVKAKSYVNAAESLIIAAIPAYDFSAGNTNQNEVAVYTELLKEMLPLPETYLREVAVKLQQTAGQVSSPEQFAQNISRSLRSQINGYMWRRAGWIIAGIALTAFLLLSSAKKQGRQQTVRRNYDDLIY